MDRVFRDISKGRLSNSFGCQNLSMGSDERGLSVVSQNKPLISNPKFFEITLIRKVLDVVSSPISYSGAVTTNFPL